MLEPLVQTIQVPCDQEKAFRIFIEEMGTWWPLGKRSMSIMNGGEPPKALNTEAQLGGRIIEISQDDTEHHWGTITTYDPHTLISMDFHMGLPPANASLVEVRFEAVDAGNTQVELTQSNWEAFGDMAEMMRNGYGSGWILIFNGGYKSACGG